MGDIHCMNVTFDFREDSTFSSKIIHIVEHGGKGTIRKLVSPLALNGEQLILSTEGLRNISLYKNAKYVLHITTHIYPVISELESLLMKNINISIFFHVGPMCYEIKNKLGTLSKISILQKKYRLKCFCPSNQISIKFKEYGIDVIAIQMGIPMFDVSATIDCNEKYKNKIITVCTNADPRYIHIKGVDYFANLMEMTNNKSNALILGFKGEYRGIPCLRMETDEFLNVLKNAKMYIQLSRTESYNVTAIQAKRLRVPIIVSNVDGHIDCMKNPINRVDTLVEACNLMKVYEECGNSVANENYYDSLERENLEMFVTSIKENLM